MRHLARRHLGRALPAGDLLAGPMKALSCGNPPFPRASRGGAGSAGPDRAARA